MQKYKKSLVVLLMCCLVLAGCGDKEKTTEESSTQEMSTVEEVQNAETPEVSDEDDQLSIDGSIGNTAREQFKLKTLSGFEESKEVLEFIGCKEDDVAGCNFIVSEDDFKGFTVGLLTCFADTEAQVESNIAATLTEKNVAFMVSREGNRLVVGIGDTSDVNLEAIKKYAAATSNKADFEESSEVSDVADESSKESNEESKNSNSDESAMKDAENNVTAIDSGAESSFAESTVDVNNSASDTSQVPMQETSLGEEIVTNTEVTDESIDETHVDPAGIPQSAKEAAKANAITEEPGAGQATVGGPDAELSDSDISGFDELIQREDDLAFPDGSGSGSDKPQGVN